MRAQHSVHAFSSTLTAFSSSSLRRLQNQLNHSIISPLGQNRALRIGEPTVCVHVRECGVRRRKRPRPMTKVEARLLERHERGGGEESAGPAVVEQRLRDRVVQPAVRRRAVDVELHAPRVDVQQTADDVAGRPARMCRAPTVRRVPHQLAATVVGDRVCIVADAVAVLSQHRFD